MKNAVLVNDVDGKPHIIVLSQVTGAEIEPGEPAQPAVEAQDAVEDDPGEPASGDNPGRPPRAGHPAVEAKPAVPAKPETVTIKSNAGDVKVAMTRAAAIELLNGAVL